MGEKRNSCRTWLRKPEGKGPLGRNRRRWEDNTKVDIKLECVGRICLNLGRDMRQDVVNSVMNRRVLQNSVNIVTRWGTGSFLRRTLLCRFSATEMLHFRCQRVNKRTSQIVAWGAGARQLNVGQQTAVGHMAGWNWRVLWFSEMWVGVSVLEEPVASIGEL